jgi:hypothetical protein
LICRSVYALFCAISMQRIGAPSIRLWLQPRRPFACNRVEHFEERREAVGMAVVGRRGEKETVLEAMREIAHGPNAGLSDAPSHPSPLHPPADRGDNAIRAHLAEFGIVAQVGRNGVEQLFARRH